MHPIIEEISRSKDVPRYDVLRRWARALVDDIQPKLDRLEQIDAASAAKKAGKVATA